MGSRRKVRSRVHGGVKEARDRLLFAPPPPPPTASFLQEDVAPAATAASPSNSLANAHRLFVLLRAWDLPPAGKQQHHRVGGCCQPSALLPSSAAARSFCLQPPWCEVSAACLHLHRKSELSAQTRSSFTILLQRSNSKKGQEQFKQSKNKNLRRE